MFWYAAQRYNLYMPNDRLLHSHKSRSKAIALQFQAKQKSDSYTIYLLVETAQIDQVGSIGGAIITTRYAPAIFTAVLHSPYKPLLQ